MIQSPPAEALRETEALIRRLGDAALSRQPGIDHEFKADKTYVTTVDREVETELRDHIGRNYPDHRMLGEESGFSNPGRGEWTWVVDPIDGTSNYALGLAMWGVSVALIRYGRPQYAWIYLPVQGEMFTARAGQGAFLNNGPISARREREMRPQDLLGVDTRSLTGYDFSFPQDARALGSAAMAVSYAACGRYVGFFLAAWYVWDIAAALLLALEAGLKVTTFNNHPFNRFAALGSTPGPPLLFAAPELHSRLLAAITPRRPGVTPEMIINRAG